jgi:hypothetical protein
MYGRGRTGVLSPRDQRRASTEIQELPPEYPLEGVHVPHNPPALAPFSKLSNVVTFRYLLYFQAVVSVLVLALCIGLIATTPKDTSVQPRIGFAMFSCIFSIIVWLYTYVFSVTIDDEYIQRNSRYILLVVNLFFSLGAAIGLTVGISPAGSCTDEDYLGSNDLVAGSTSRCRLVQATFVFLWFGMSHPVDILTVSIYGKFHLRCPEVERGSKRATFGDKLDRRLGRQYLSGIFRAPVRKAQDPAQGYLYVFARTSNHIY